MHELIEELQQYHKDKARHLFELEQGVASLCDDHAPDDYIDMLQTLFGPFRVSAESEHHYNEELILTELRKTSAPIHRRVDEISADHEAFSRIVIQITTMIRDESVSPVELGSTINYFVATYYDHANGEENIFFPIADRYLERPHWLKIKKSWSGSVGAGHSRPVDSSSPEARIRP